MPAAPDHPLPRHFPWLQVLVHLLGLLPLAGIVIALLTGGLGVNPIQAVEQRLGRAALHLLAATLAVTPLSALTGWSRLPRHRRALGLYAFLYASLHFTIFAALDYGFDLREILRLALEKPFILPGLLAGIILLLLAATSFHRVMRRNPKAWKTLHRLIYPAGLLAVLHYAWAKKGSLFPPGGDVLMPLLWGLLIVLLLVLRIPAVRRWSLRVFRR